MFTPIPRDATDHITGDTGYQSQWSSPGVIRCPDVPPFELDERPTNKPVPVNGGGVGFNDVVVGQTTEA
jgi:hypothetical protein